MTAAVAGAARRPLGDSWLWARKGLSADISALVAVTLAGWGMGDPGAPHGLQLFVNEDAG